MFVINLENPITSVKSTCVLAAGKSDTSAVKLAFLLIDSHPCGGYFFLNRAHCRTHFTWIFFNNSTRRYVLVGKATLALPNNRVVTAIPGNVEFAPLLGPRASLTVLIAFCAGSGSIRLDKNILCALVVFADSPDTKETFSPVALCKSFTCSLRWFCPLPKYFVRYSLGLGSVLMGAASISCG